MDEKKKVRERTALEALDAILPGRGVPIFGLVQPLQDLWDAISPDVASDLKSTPVKTSLPNEPEVLHFNYDEGHAGRVTVPGSDGGSISVDWLLGLDDMTSYIKQNLYFRPSQNVAKGSKAAVTMFMPGLNTLHEPREDEIAQPAVERMRYYVRVLGLEMGQVHMGTFLDQEDATVRCRRSPILRGILGSGLLPDIVQPTRDDEIEDAFVFESRQLDQMQVVLSMTNMIDTPLKISIRKWLDWCQVHDEKIVFIGYSRASVEIDAALNQYVDNRKGSKSEMEEWLRDHVTVVTIGSASQGFPDGPKYVHVATWTDHLSSANGVTARNNARKGGKDCVYVNGDSPFPEGAADNHNFGCVTSQLAGIALAMNGANGWEDVWEEGQKEGGLKLPDVETTKAMIKVTNGLANLWDEEGAIGEMGEDFWPSREEALDILKNNVGEEFVNRISKEFTVNEG